MQRARRRLEKYQKKLDGYRLDKSPNLTNHQLVCTNLPSNLPQLKRWGCKVFSSQGKRIKIKDVFSIWRWHGWYEKEEKIVEAEDVSRFHPQFDAFIDIPVGTQGRIVFHAIKQNGPHGKLEANLE